MTDAERLQIMWEFARKAYELADYGEHETNDELVRRLIRIGGLATEALEDTGERAVGA